MVQKVQQKSKKIDQDYKYKRSRSGKSQTKKSKLELEAFDDEEFDRVMDEFIASHNLLDEFLFGLQQLDSMRTIKLDSF
jgi:hypothetical protein